MAFVFAPFLLLLQSSDSLASLLFLFLDFVRYEQTSRIFTFIIPEMKKLFHHHHYSCQTFLTPKGKSPPVSYLADVNVVLALTKDSAVLTIHTIQVVLSFCWRLSLSVYLQYGLAPVFFFASVMGC